MDLRTLARDCREMLKYFVSILMEKKNSSNRPRKRQHLDRKILENGADLFFGINRIVPSKRITRMSQVGKNDDYHHISVAKQTNIVYLRVNKDRHIISELNSQAQV